MAYKNSVAIIRTRKDNVVGAHMISTRGYEQINPDRFAYDGYRCREFEIGETVGGVVVVVTKDRFEYSGADIRNEILFENVYEIELLTAHKV